MFRKAIQILACLSVLLAGGSHSLHMARDSYRRPSASDLDGVAANSDENSLESMPIGHRIHQLQHQQQQQHPQRYQSLPPGGAASDDSINRQQQQQHLQQPHNAPIALQELFAGTATLDIRLEQQQQQQQRQLHDDMNNINVDHRRLQHEGGGGDDDDEPQPQQHKRGNGEEAIGPGDNPSPLPQTSGGGKPNMPPPPIPHGIASQLMLRSARGQRNYDVPQIGEFSIFSKDRARICNKMQK